MLGFEFGNKKTFTGESTIQPPPLMEDFERTKLQSSGIVCIGGKITKFAEFKISSYCQVRQIFCYSLISNHSGQF